jgi:hypothetical protein
VAYLVFTQDDKLTKAMPANRTPQAPSPSDCKRKNSHGPVHKLKLDPAANNPMLVAPFEGSPVKAATIKAE